MGQTGKLQGCSGKRAVLTNSEPADCYRRFAEGETRRISSTYFVFHGAVLPRFRRRTQVPQYWGTDPRG
jgi:hypothetical protein